MRCLVQCQYIFRGVQPTRELVRRTLRQWLRSGTTPDNVTLNPVCWNGHDAKRIRRCVRSAGGATTDCPGVVEYYHRPDLILTDFDNDKPVTLPRICEIMGELRLKVRAAEYKKTRRGWHVVLFLARDLQPLETVAVQAILGSDPKRETFNLARVMGGRAKDSIRWNLLFDYKLS